jgi:hypothetical protein
LIWEKGTNLPTAVRVLNAVQVRVLPVHFFALTSLHKIGLDFFPHELQVAVLDPHHNRVAEAPISRFVYGYNISKEAPGGYVLGTQFELQISEFGVFWVQAFLDKELAIQVPILLLRA